VDPRGTFGYAALALLLKRGSAWPTFSTEVDLMTEPNVTIDINVELLPFGHATVATGYAHPDRFPEAHAATGPTVTPVMPLTSSVITPGHARPASA
jgi:hypothetical protein